MMFLNTFSKGRPSFSYMANRKHGNMRPIIRNSAGLFPMWERVNRYMGTPIPPAMEKQISWRFVKLKASLVLILFRSLGTGT